MSLKKNIAIAALFALVFAVSPAWGQQASAAGLGEFSIKPYSANDFYIFVKVFSEMRGPIRQEILKDKKTNFEDADPLKYALKVKDKRDVKDALKGSKITWDQFVQLFGNVLMAYFSTQPEATKAALIRQLADYGIFMNVNGIPPEYREMVTDVIKTDAGSTLAAIALEQIVAIPAQNISIAKDNKSQLDRMFYTKYWIEDLN